MDDHRMTLRQKLRVRRLYRLFGAALAALFYCLGLPEPVQAQCTGQPGGNTVCASPSGGGAGVPRFRALVPADIPAGGGTSLTVGSGGTPVTGTPAAAGATTSVLYNNAGQLNSTAASGGGTTQFLRADMTWAVPAGGGGGTPAGATGAVQYNNAGIFGGIALGANNVLGALSAATPVALTMPSCSGGANALN